MQGLDWGAIRRFASTGEASSPDDSHWLSARAGYKPILEYIGGTEIGGSFLAGSMLQPQIPSAFSTPTLGPPPWVPISTARLLRVLQDDGAALQACAGILPYMAAVKQMNLYRLTATEELDVHGACTSCCGLSDRMQERLEAAIKGCTSAGTQVVLLSGDEGSRRQSVHGSGEAVVGELALVPPCLGWSQRLLNRDHHAAYYQVRLLIA